MRWVKHMTGTRQDEKIARLIDRYGMAGYGTWWAVVEVVAGRLENGGDPSVTYSVTQWSHLLSLRGSHVWSALEKLVVTGLVTVLRQDSDITVRIPNLLKYRDEYSRKSGQTPESVPTKEQKQNTDTHTDGKAEKSTAPEGAGDVLLFPVSGPTEDELVEATAERLCDRHPKRRTCGPSEARKALKAIIGKLPKSERAAKLERIDSNHEGWCKSELWTKEGCEYAKGLANWLAPTMGRYDEPPPSRASPSAGVYRPVQYFDPKTITG